MIGSDYPFDMASSDPVGAVEVAGLDPDALRHVVETTAIRFLRPLGSSS
jgi:hypothetical protein